MVFNPKAEPCWQCGHELDECVCTVQDGVEALDTILTEVSPDFWETEDDS
jgi:hypothetical protein